MDQRQKLVQRKELPHCMSDQGQRLYLQKQLHRRQVLNRNLLRKNVLQL